jgi:23S rRNA pseudouridine1911/1915/1917 synthase
MAARKKEEESADMDLNILYEDGEILVVEKPVGIESQSARSLEPDMVSEIKKHIHTLSAKQGEPYVGVIHRLDKPVGGAMVYAKTPKAAESLSRQVSRRQMEKIYYAAVCGKPVENFGSYVDYLWKDGKNNCSKIVDKGIKGAKLAELH